jgi:phenol hydroxylase P0 protein
MAFSPTTGKPHELRRYVRVTGTLADRFVTFEFAIGDPSLSVDLVLQADQFREFCARHDAIELTPEQGAALDHDRMKWRYGAPGIDH